VDELLDQQKKARRRVTWEPLRNTIPTEPLRHQSLQRCQSEIWVANYILLTTGRVHHERSGA